MLAAGINPMVAFSQGGASTPSVSAATVQPKMALSEGINSAANKAMLALQAEQLKASIEQTKTVTAKTGKEAKGVALQKVILGQEASAQSLRYRMEGQNLAPQKVRREIEKLMEERDLTSTQEEQMRAAMPSIISLAKANATLQEQKIPQAEADANAAAKGDSRGLRNLDQTIWRAYIANEELTAY